MAWFEYYTELSSKNIVFFPEHRVLTYGNDLQTKLNYLKLKQIYKLGNKARVRKPDWHNDEIEGESNPTAAPVKVAKQSVSLTCI